MFLPKINYQIGGKCIAPRLLSTYYYLMRFIRIVGPKILLILVTVNAGKIWASDELRKKFSEEILPLLEEYCYDCHGEGARKGKLALDAHTTFSHLTGDYNLWKVVWENLHRRNMPPADKPQLNDAQADQILSWIERAVFDYDPVILDPGRVVLRRLNRSEYQNTIRDLFGISFETQSLFPPDDTGHGFDTIGEVLTLSPLLMEKYMVTADAILDKAFGPVLGEIPLRSFPASSIQGGRSEGSFRVLPSHGSFSVNTVIPSAGTYLIKIEAAASRAGEELARMSVTAGRKFEKVVEVGSEYPAFKTYEFQVFLEKNTGIQIKASFLNDFYDPRNRNKKRRDRNLYVRKISLVSSDGLSVEQMQRRKRHLGFVGDGKFPKETAALFLSKLLSRIYRSPLSEPELGRHLELFSVAQNRSKSIYEALRVVLKASLVSPNFLFREELAPHGPIPTEAYELDDFGLANRLSYFLWSSMPDDVLWKKAAEGSLRENLRKEVLRMIDDSKAEAFISNFTGQWLQLRDLDMATPDRGRFPVFSDELRNSMRRETESFFGYVLRQNRPVTELLTADYTFSDQRLANFYDMKGKFSDEFRKVSLEGETRRQRGGLLSHSSILTVTSNPTRTSPVKRGRWVLDNLLGAPPKDPPPGIPELEEPSSGNQKSLSLRQQLAIHSRNSSCSSCHANMDAMGFAMENYDAIGNWRTKDEGKLIDPLGKLGTGETFSGPMQLQNFIVDKKQKAFLRCLTEKLMTYGIGRGMEYFDRAAIDEIAQKAGREGRGLGDLLVDVVTSRPFTHAGVHSISASPSD